MPRAKKAPPPPKRPTGRPRTLTLEVAEAFAAELARDSAHSIESAGHAIGINPNTLRSSITRYDRGECNSEADEEIGAILCEARAAHIRALREEGDRASKGKNVAGVKWAMWRLETQAPREHGRRTHLELTGSEGGPVAVTQISRAEALEKLKLAIHEDPELAKALTEGK